MAEFSQIKFDNLKDEVELFLKRAHNKADILFSKASPYGQLLTVIEELFQLSMLYLKNSINQFNLNSSNSKNKKLIRSAAIFAGHIPGRSISSTGVLRLQLKSSSSIDDIRGGRITISDKTLLKNNTNGLDYLIDLGTDKITYNLENTSQIFVNIIQGKLQTDFFTGTGNENQTIGISIQSRKDVENFNVVVSVNGEVWESKRHIFDMVSDEKACVVRTGFAGGIDVIFGNGGHGAIPQIGSAISITYILTNGSDGNIFRRTINDWKFVDSVIDGFGNSISMTTFFDTYIQTDINFGAEGESVEFTRNILPISSNNFVLGLPQQYAYEIKKLGVFTHVNAFEVNGIISIVAVPNIKLFKNQNQNYFTVDLEAFKLDNIEKRKIDRYLKSNGNIQLSRKYRIANPVLVFYTINIFVMTYSNAIDDSVNSQIIDKISEYFLNISRFERIPKLDIIKVLSDIDDIHSVDIKFVSKQNEDYHRDKLIKDINRRNEFADALDLKLDKPFTNYDPNLTIGLDPILGDIIFEPSQLPVIRGGWVDRNGLLYDDRINTSGFGSVNIIKKGTIDIKNKVNINAV